MTTNAHVEKKRLDNPPATIKFKIQRREKEGAESHWETFEIPYRRNLNVISALMDIRKNPVTIDGKATTPPVWDMSCLEQVCGICTTSGPVPRYLMRRHKSDMRYRDV